MKTQTVLKQLAKITKQLKDKNFVAASGVLKTYTEALRRELLIADDEAGLKVKVDDSWIHNDGHGCVASQFELSVSTPVSELQADGYYKDADATKYVSSPTIWPQNDIEYD